MTTTRVTFLARAIEGAINRALDYDPGTRQALTALQGKCLAICSTTPAGTLYFQVHEQRVNVLAFYEGKIDCKLTGTLTHLASLGLKDTQNLANTDVYIEGNPGVLSQWLELVKNVDVDWEQALGERIGSLPAHAIGTLVRSQQQWLGQRAKKLPGYLTELATEELRLTPSRAEADNLYQQISTLRAQTARLEARFAHLKQGLSPTP